MGRALPLQGHTRLITEDRDESLVRAREVWEPHTGSYLGGKFYLRWNQFNLTRSAIGAFEFRSRSRVRSEPRSPLYRLNFQLSGEMQQRIAGRNAISTPHNAVVHPPHADLLLDLVPQKSIFAGFEANAVEAALRARIGDCRRSENAAIEFALDRGPGKLFHSFLDWLINEIDSPQSSLSNSRKSLAAMDNMLLELFADALVGETAGGMQSMPGDIGEFRLRQVEAWIEANLGEPFGLTEMAEAASGDVRGVREAFRAFRGVTPTVYVMNARLDRARKLLLNAEPGTTITSICIACGLFHFGRFSVRYKSRFGETPSQTLARAQPRR